jgi:hypothetical protein
MQQSRREISCVNAELKFNVSEIYFVSFNRVDVITHLSPTYSQSVKSMFRPTMEQEGEDRHTIYVTDTWSFITSALIMETKAISEAFVCNSTLTLLIARQSFRIFILCEMFKSRITEI